MAENYMRRVIRRGVTDTLDFFGWNRRTLLFLALWFVGTAIYGLFAGWRAATEEMLVAASYVFIPVGGLAVLLLIYNLVTAPSRMQADVEKHSKKLELKLNKITNKQDAVDHLSTLLSEGINTIWNGPVVNDDELEALEAHWQDWHARVVAYLTEHFNQADVDHFNRLGVLPKVTRGGTYIGSGENAGTHRRILMTYALQDQRLREIVRDHNVTHV